MEDNEEEEDDDNYPMFTEEYGDTAMEYNEEEGGEEPGHQMSPLMFLVGSFLMQSKNVIQKRRS